MTDRIREILVLHHTHTDIGYTHPQPVVMELERRFIDQALDACEEMASLDEPSRLRWTCECTYPLQFWLERTTSRNIDRFKALAHAGLIGGAALPFHPTPMMDYAQWARFLQPAVELRGALDLAIRTAILHDVNGLPWPAVQHLSEAGIEMLITGINIVFGTYPFQRPGAFRWQGPAEHSLLAFNGEHYAAFNRELHTHTGSTERMAEGLKHYLEHRLPKGYPFNFVYLTATHPFFVDNNPPEPALARLIAKWNAEGRTPRIRTILPEDLLTEVHRFENQLETHAGDWTDAWNFGAGSTAVETRAARHARQRLHKATALMALNGPAREDAPARLAEARLNLDLWEEHTWGAQASIALPYRDGVYEQWSHKAQFAWQARSLTALLLRDQLELASGNPAEGAGCSAVLVMNPLNEQIHTTIRLPKRWFGGTMDDPSIHSEEGRAAGSLKTIWQHFSSNVLRIELDRESWDGKNGFLAEVTLPPLSISALSTLTLKPAEPAASCHQDGRKLESDAFALIWDSKTGRVTSLIDKRSGREVLDSKAPFSLFEPVHESPVEFDPDGLHRGRESIFNFDWEPMHANIPGWLPDWKAQRHGMGEPISIEVVHGALGIALVRKVTVRGTTSFVQTIRLRADRPVVECDVLLDKTNCFTPEALYLYVPLGLRKWQAHYDVQGLSVAFDDQQLPGVIRDYLTVDRYVCMHNREAAVTLACPDAPLVQLGGFNFGRRRPIDRSGCGHIAAWPMNNYWMTNFRAAQPGVVHLRYELSVESAHSPSRSAHMAALACQVPDIEVHPIIQADTATAGPMVELSTDQWSLLAVEPGPAPRSILVRLLNDTMQPVQGELSLGRKTISGAWRVNLCDGDELDTLSVKDGRAQLTIPARTFATVRIVTPR